MRGRGPVVAVAASGGGHTGYAVAAAEALAELGAEPLFVADPGDRWTLGRLARLFPGARVVPLPRLRAPGEPLLKALPRAPPLAAWVHRVSRLLRRHGASSMLCTGSNHSLLAAAAAAEAGLGVVCLEAIDRVATRSRTPAILHDLAAVPVALHWPLQRRLYRRGVVVGPVYPRPRGRVEPPRGVEPGYVLVLTGSLGNPRLVRLLLGTRLGRVVLQTGRLTPPEPLARLRPGWVVFRFTSEVERWVAGASVVVSHQGLGVAEAALAHGKPVVVAYNPDIYMSSGRRDAMLLARLLGGVFLDLSDAEPADLEEAVERARGRRPPRLPWGAPWLARLALDAAGGR